MKPKNYVQSFKFAFKGIVRFFKAEPNAWIHLLAAIAVLALSYFSQLKTNEWLWIILAISLVFICEMFNTALEYLADKVDQSYDKHIEISKDISAAATLIASIFAVIVAAMILLPKWI